MALISSFVADPKSKTNIENETSKILQEFYPENLERPTPLNVEYFLDAVVPQITGRKGKKFDVKLVDSLDPGVEASTDFFEGKILFTESAWDDLCSGDYRKRFTGAHESYHAIIHSIQVMQSLTDEKTLMSHLKMMRQGRVPRYSDPEWQANYGAGCFMMPKRTIVPLFEQIKHYKIEDILLILGEEYGVSQHAAFVRLDKLKLINPQDLAIRRVRNKLQGYHR